MGHGYAETLTGSTWTEAALPSPGGSTSVSMGFGMSCTTAGTAPACVAVGSYVSGGASHPLVETLSSGAWSTTTPSAPSGSTSAQLTGASCTTNTECAAVGTYSPSRAVPPPLSATLSPPPATHLSVATTPTATAGSPVNLIVTALDATGNVVTDYTGTVHFTSTDPQAGLPSNYTFTSGDKGIHTFTGGLTLKTAGTQTVTATDTADATRKGTSGTVAVSPAAASTLVVTAPADASALTPATVTVTAKDPYGNAATGYTGTVHFTTSDATAMLPANYAFIGRQGRPHLHRGSRSTPPAPDGHRHRHGHRASPAPAARWPWGRHRPPT